MPLTETGKCFTHYSFPSRFSLEQKRFRQVTFDPSHRFASEEDPPDSFLPTPGCVDELGSDGQKEGRKDIDQALSLLQLSGGSGSSQVGVVGSSCSVGFYAEALRWFSLGALLSARAVHIEAPRLSPCDAMGLVQAMGVSERKREVVEVALLLSNCVH